VALLTRDDLRRHSWFAWTCLAVMAGEALWFWSLGKHMAAEGTLAALVGCLGLILPPRERMAVLPARLRALPRGLDATPVLAALLSSPGYGLGWFYGANPYDETVHLLSGALAGSVLAGLLLADGRPRSLRRCALVAAGGGLVLGITWELFEWATGLIGDWTDTWTDVALTTGGAALGAAAWRGLAGVGSDAGWRGPLQPPGLGPAADA
jgi:hypothetical protein